MNRINILDASLADKIAAVAPSLFCPIDALTFLESSSPIILPLGDDAVFGA